MQGPTVAEFYRQLAMLVRSDMPLPESIRQLSGALGSRRFRQTLAEVGSATANGDSLAAAMARHPGDFAPLYVRLVQAGEAGNVLADVLDELAHSATQTHDLLRRTREALAYPVIVIIATAFLAVGLSVWTLPVFEQMFAEILGSEPLPPVTVAIFAVAGVIRAVWWLCVAVLGVVSLLSFYLMVDTAASNRLLYRCMRYLPGFHGIATAGAYARIARLMAVSMRHRIPVTDTLALLADTIELPGFRAHLADWARRCDAGETLKGIVTLDKWVDGLMQLAIVHGEEAELPENLLELSQVYETRVMARRQAAIVAWTLVSYGFMALTIGGGMLAALLPLFKLIDYLGG